MITAVLVIDVQQGLCQEPGAAFDCVGTIRRINRVTCHAREVGAKVIFIQHESESGLLKYGSKQWQLAQGLEVDPSDLFVRKKTPDSFLRTDLETLLAKHQVERLVICGMHTEFCVDTTVRKALARGYPVILVSDAHTSAGNDTLSPPQVIAHHNATLTSISSFGPRVIAVASSALKLTV
jgi:nicotinamidase-related amidase